MLNLRPVSEYIDQFLMQINLPVHPARIVKRYKRFLADVITEDGESLTVHCPNSGSMLSCWGKGWPCLISDSGNPARKLRYTLEMTHNGRCWIGINTHRTNALAEEALVRGIIPVPGGFVRLRREVKYGRNSRIDLLLEREDGGKTYVEVKNVTLAENGVFLFPDAVTRRGLKHLAELTDMVRQGHRAVMLYIIQRSDGDKFRPADAIDPAYGRALRQARSEGVDLMCYRAEVNPQYIRVEQAVPVEL